MNILKSQLFLSNKYYYNKYYCSKYNYLKNMTETVPRYWFYDHSKKIKSIFFLSNCKSKTLIS